MYKKFLDNFLFIIFDSFFLFGYYKDESVMLAIRIFLSIIV